MSRASRVKVRFFASLREEVGIGEAEVEADNLSNLLAALSARLQPEAMQALRQEHVRIAVNQALVSGEIDLADGDEVAFLPPVTGG